VYSIENVSSVIEEFHARGYVARFIEGLGSVRVAEDDASRGDENQDC
jgi:hypothetical protein